MSSLARKYTDSLAEEMRIYHDCVDVHSLPPIFHYWSNEHLLPALRPFGVSGAEDIFVQNMAAQFIGESACTRRFLSLGSGNCDLEVSIARQLVGRGFADFILDCVDLNPAMLERGRVAARVAGVEDQLRFITNDLNSWTSAHEYHAAMANQSLHHVLNLESLYGEVSRSLRPHGCFVISDMIGKNGHLRWPEALQVIHELWRQLPPSYRFNRNSLCYEELFADHDCSGEGFEGVRSQDILPLLLDRFHFRFFFPFANVIDPFIDRSFGPNFDPALAWDRAFIDRVHARDVAGLSSGHLKPTHMFAVVAKESGAPVIYPDRLSPEFCVRAPQVSPRLSAPDPGPLYQWDKWHDRAREELTKASGMLAETANLVRRRTEWAHALERECAERLEWGLDIERQVGESIEFAAGLRKDLDAHREWAASLERQLRERTDWVGILQAETFRLQADLEERTSWAQKLDAELKEKTAWSDLLLARLEAQTRRTAQLERQLSARLVRKLNAMWKRLTGAP